MEGMVVDKNWYCEIRKPSITQYKGMLRKMNTKTVKLMPLRLKKKNSVYKKKCKLKV